MSQPLNGCVRSHASTGQNVPRRLSLSHPLCWLEESSFVLPRQIGRMANDCEEAAEFGVLDSERVLSVVADTLAIVSTYAAERTEGLTASEAGRVSAAIDLAAMALELLSVASYGAEQARKRREVDHEE